MKCSRRQQRGVYCEHRRDWNATGTPVNLNAPWLRRVIEVSKLFSERNGLSNPRSAIQIREMDDSLRNGLWNALQLAIWDEDPYSHVAGSNLRPLFLQLWHNYFKAPIDTIPEHTSQVIARLRHYFFASDWNVVYDFIEFIANNVSRSWAEALVGFANAVLERDLSGWRFVGNRLAPISSVEESQSIESALTNTKSLGGAHAHPRTALELLSDRENPDYRNSIKESISAVESITQCITGNSSATLGAALKDLEKKSAVHPALKSSFTALYGWTSDSGGIRHAMLEESKLSFTDAKFMLVACTAFVNYLVGKAADFGMKLE